MLDDSHRPHHVERRGPRSAIPIIIGLALLVAVWLIPDLSPREALPVQGDQQLRARLVEAPGAPDAQGVVTARVELLEGDRAGERTDALVQGGTMGPGIPGVPVEYRAGDEVMVTTFTGPAGGTQAQISDTWRVPVLAALAALFALAVVLVGGWRGLTSLLALALTLLVVVKVMVPLTLRGADPVILAVGIAAALTVVSLLLLFAVGTQSPLTILNGEIVAVEVVRALVGSIGIVAAVPLTTLIATWLVPASTHGADERREPATAV
jgi:uncharacterized membrane protein